MQRQVGEGGAGTGREPADAPLPMPRLDLLDHPVTWRMRALYALGMLWAAPMTLLGLGAGLALVPFGARPRLERRDCAIVFHRVPLGPGGAMTLGNVILNTAHDLDAPCTTYEHRAGRCVHPRIRIGDHERAHVLQAMALGPLFLPLYFAFGGVSVRNRFERAADRYALTGHGWWPFA